MAVASSINWQSCRNAGIPFGWNGAGQPPEPITILHTAGTPFIFNIATNGSVTFAITGTVAASSNTITSLSATSNLCVGQAISGPGIPPYSWIASINTGSSTLAFRNGFEDSTVNDLPATASGTAVALAISDLYPLGSLLASVSPSTGVTITDQNADGQGYVSYLGNGSAIMNLSGQGEGNFEMTFASAGTFVIECMFVTSDRTYEVRRRA